MSLLKKGRKMLHHHHHLHPYHHQTVALRSPRRLGDLINNAKVGLALFPFTNYTFVLEHYCTYIKYTFKKYDVVAMMFIVLYRYVQLFHCIVFTLHTKQLHQGSPSTITKYSTVAVLKTYIGQYRMLAYLCSR